MWQNGINYATAAVDALTRRAVLSVDTDVWVESLPSDLDIVFQSDLV